MRTYLLALAATLGVFTGCAGFERGEYWRETSSSTGGAMEDTSTTPMSTSGAETGADEEGEASTGLGSTGGGLPATSYADEIHGLMVAGCERCHEPNGSANDTGLIVLADDPAASYELVVDFVDTAQPSSSRLLTKGAGQGHGGGTIYDDRSAEYDTILRWIDTGASP